jgi:hypothetical protein
MILGGEDIDFVFRGARLREAKVAYWRSYESVFLRPVSVSHTRSDHWFSPTA